MPDWIVDALYVVGPLLVLFFVGGLLLPRRFEVSRSVVVSAPPEKVFPFINSFERWPLWSPFDTEDPTIVWDSSGPQSGVGAKRSWKSRKMGDGSQTIAAVDPPTAISMKLAIAGGFEPFDVRFDLVPEAGGTHVTWTDRGTLPSAPHWRWMGVLLLRSICGRSFAKGLAALKRVVEAA